jgi:hypothetical protein
MINYSVSLFPFFFVAFANFFLSWLYYSPIMPWFKAWEKGVALDAEKQGMTKEVKTSMPRLMSGAVLASFLFSYSLQVIVHSINATDFLTGALVGIVIWAGFAVSHSLNTQFEGRKPVVLLINHGLYFFSYLLFGGIVAVL